MSAKQDMQQIFQNMMTGQNLFTPLADAGVTCDGKEYSAGQSNYMTANNLSVARFAEQGRDVGGIA